MTARPTRLEASRGYVLAWCSECPPWRRLTGTRPAALLLAADHMALCHGDADAARKLREQAARLRRHADE